MSTIIKHKENDLCRCSACLLKKFDSSYSPTFNGKRVDHKAALAKRAKELHEDEGWSPKEARLLALEGM
jgi:hypothetical protein